jgi:hypothetical protein
LLLGGVVGPLHRMARRPGGSFPFRVRSVTQTICSMRMGPWLGCA